ncbi:hypothetical protein [Pseudomonas aeruginosa]|uniref:hypothetical protein n=1 Tax=Pseudomonas aeruginosa TaxID=287 RepID=UPI0034E0B532
MMSEVRLNLGILFVMVAGACAGFSWIEGTAGFGSDFAQRNHEHLMLAFPTAAAIFGMLGGFMIGTASMRRPKEAVNANDVAVE